MIGYPNEQDGATFPARDYPPCPARKILPKANNKSFIDQNFLFRMAGDWPCCEFMDLDSVLLHKHEKKKELAQITCNKLLTHLASLSRTGEWWPSVIFIRALLCSVSGHYSPVRRVLQEKFYRRQIINPLLTKIFCSRWLEIGLVASLWTSTPSCYIDMKKKRTGPNNM